MKVLSNDDYLVVTISGRKGVGVSTTRSFKLLLENATLVDVYSTISILSDDIAKKGEIEYEGFKHYVYEIKDKTNNYSIHKQKTNINIDDFASRLISIMM